MSDNIKNDKKNNLIITGVGDKITVCVSGNWNIRDNLREFDFFLTKISDFSHFKEIEITSKDLSKWDTSLLILLKKILYFSKERGIEINYAGLTDGLKRLIEISELEKTRKEAIRENREENFLIGTGDFTLKTIREINQIFEFIGSVTVAFLKFILGKATFRSKDLFEVILDSGARALPIVSLIAILVGIIFAFIGSIQLKKFGMQILVADIVGIGMVRVMAAVMTGVIMAGRTGAAFAAKIGTMQVNEEIDALKTFGINHIEFIVLPKVIGLTLMMPLLCIYADFMGIIGGFIIGIFMLDLNFMEYYVQTQKAINLRHFSVGILHSFVFGILVSMSGCLRGLQCGRSAWEVGKATTSSVVTSIVLMVIATAIITYCCYVLGI